MIRNKKTQYIFVAGLTGLRCLNQKAKRLGEIFVMILKGAPWSSVFQLKTSLSIMREKPLFNQQVYPTILLLLVLAVIVGGIWYAMSQGGVGKFSITNEALVVLTEQGFEPYTVVIWQGGKVTFSTNVSERSFWPASNLHPIHSIYSDFDTEHPILPEDSWSFTFDQVGKWKYHDHLMPNYMGIVIVRGDGVGDAVGATESLEDCSGNKKRYQRQCWENQIATTLESQGLSQAFMLLDHLYNTEPAFKSSCHAYTHIIGDAAYWQFIKDDGELELLPQTSYCGSGFFHGFMETMLFTTGDMQGARDLCSYAKEQLGYKAGKACYHGIGHGLTDGSQPQARVDPDAMIKEGLLFCEVVAETDEHVDRCVSGVFNALAIYSNSKRYPEYQLDISETDPYELCRRQEKEYLKKACYRELDVAVFRISGRDLRVSLAFAEEIVNDVHAAIAAGSLVEVGLSRDTSTDSNEIKAAKVCREIQERLHMSCIRGFSTGIIESGPPEREYEGGLKFCQSDILTEKEQQACMDSAMRYLRVLYSTEKMQTVCATAIQEPFKEQFCS